MADKYELYKSSISLASKTPKLQALWRDFIVQSARREIPPITIPEVPPEFQKLIKFAQCQEDPTLRIQALSFLEVLSHKNVYVLEWLGTSNFIYRNIRMELMKFNSKIRVVKSTCCQKMLLQTSYSDMAHLFNAPTICVFNDDDIRKQGPLLRSLRRQQRMYLLGGKIGKDLVEADQLFEMTKLPSMEVLFGEALGQLSLPGALVTNVLQRPQIALVQNLEQYMKQIKEK